MVKLKVSYEDIKELTQLINLLGAAVHNLKMVPKQSGEFKRAYIELIDIKDIEIIRDGD